jgi:hypothetical protein
MLVRFPQPSQNGVFLINSVALVLAGVESNRVGSNFSLRDRVEERPFDSQK